MSLFEFTSLPDGTVAISRFTYQGEAVVNVPSKYDNKPVTLIDAMVFKDSYVEEVTLPDTITTIEKQAFFGCRYLTHINLSAVKHIKDYAFAECQSLDNVSLTDSLTELGPAAFYNCTSLSRISIPDPIKELHSLTFAQCTNLQDVTLPREMNSLAPAVFFNCPLNGPFIIPDGIQELSTSTLPNTPIDIILPSTVKEIKDRVFLDRGQPYSITIPASVTKIHPKAGPPKGCSSIIIKCKPDTVAERWAKENAYPIELQRSQLKNALNLIDEERDDIIHE